MNFVATFRRLASLTFIAGNLNLLVFGAELSVAGVLLLCTSASLFLSAKNIKWLYAAGICMIMSWAIIGLRADGTGTLLQQLAPIFAIAQGLLLMRAGYNISTGKEAIATHFLAKPFALVDKYALASAGMIELPGTMLAAAAATLSGNTALMISGILWSIANVLLIFSDPNLYKK